MPENATEISVSSPEYFLDQMKKAGLYYETDLCDSNIAAEIIQKIPENIAGKYNIIPLCMDCEKLVLITNNEQAFKDVSQIQKDLKMSVKLLFAADDNVKAALSHYYHTTNEIGSRRGSESLLSSVDTTPLRRTLNAMIQDAAKRKASDIHLLPSNMGIQVLMRINGHLIDFTEEYNIKSSEEYNVINIIKNMDKSGQTDVGKSNMPDKGSFDIIHGDIVVDVRIATTPVGSVLGRQKVNLRLLPQNKKIVKLENIGYPPKDLAAIRKVLFKSASGLFLNSGPTGSGKTTSLYAQIYNVRDTIGEPLNIMTIEDPIEIHEPTFCQVQVREAQQENLSLTAQKILKVGLRLDPDIFLYGEIRDKKDAEVAIEASTTGHKVFSTVHAKGCVATIARLLDLGVSRTSLLSELNMIISQRLVGILCPHCSTTHTLTDDEIDILSKEEYKKLTMPGIKLKERGNFEAVKTCPHCTFGFQGRVAVDEYIAFDMELRDALLHETRFSEIEDLLRTKKFHSMWEKGLDMVALGQSDLHEIIHVIGKD